MYELAQLLHPIIALVVFVGFWYFVVRGVFSLANGGLKANKDRLKGLETDYVWRRVKVLYIAISGFVVTLSAVGAYTSTVRVGPSGFGTGSSVELGTFALFVGTIVAWLVYKSLLPRIYVYLRRGPID